MDKSHRNFIKIHDICPLLLYRIDAICIYINDMIRECDFLRLRAHFERQKYVRAHCSRYRNVILQEINESKRIDRKKLIL